MTAETPAAGAFTTEAVLRFRDFDYLGHMTATSYLALVEEARVQWLAGTDPDGLPAYVVAEQTLLFHREILPTDGPLTIVASGRAIGEDRFEATETITGSTGHVHATSHALLVAWDRERRRPRVLTESEHAVLEGRTAAGVDVPDDGPVHRAPSRRGEP